MSEELQQEVALENHTLAEYGNTAPSHLVVLLTERSIQTLQAIRKAFEAAAEQLPSDFVYGLEVGFYSFDYMVEDDDADADEHGEQPLKQWDGRWEGSKVRVCRDGFRFKSNIKHADVDMETDMLTFAEFEDEIRKFRSLQMAAGIEAAMPGDETVAPARPSSGLSI